MAKAVRFHKQGGPEVMQYDDVQVGDPGPGQARIRHTAIGVNFVDVYQRSGLYPMQLPQVAGNEGAGVVEAVGQGVTDLKPAIASPTPACPARTATCASCLRSEWSSCPRVSRTSRPL